MISHNSLRDAKGQDYACGLVSKEALTRKTKDKVIGMQLYSLDGQRSNFWGHMTPESLMSSVEERDAP